MIILLYFVVSRLHTVDQTRRHDNNKLQNIVQHKQQLINAQDERIQSLDVANNKLLSALSQLKDRCHMQNHNGLASPIQHRIALDDDDIKQSSC